MIPLVAALVLALHGLIHLIGFVVPWRIATLDGFPYATTALWGRLELGASGAQVLGLAWLVVAVAFVAAAVGVGGRRPWAIRLTVLAAVASLAICLLGSPAAFAGVVVNAAILVIVAARQLGPRRPVAASPH